MGDARQPAEMRDETARELGRKALGKASEALTRHGAHEGICAERWAEVKHQLGEIWTAIDGVRAAIAKLHDEDKSEAVANREARLKLLYWVAGGLGVVALALLGVLLRVLLAGG